MDKWIGLFLWFPQATTAKAPSEITLLAGCSTGDSVYTAPQDTWSKEMLTENSTQDSDILNVQLRIASMNRSVQVIVVRDMCTRTVHFLKTDQ